jgi:hypothetical protein
VKSKIFKFKNWKRVVKGGRKIYFHRGKFTSAAKFNKANSRRKSKLVTFFVDDITRKAKKILPPKEKKELALCRVAGRDNLYQQIKKDRRKLFETLSDEEFSALRVVVQIGSARKKFRFTDKGRGHRTFIDLRKFKNFLGLNYRYSSESYPDWSKSGVCKYEKSVFLTVRKMRGERILGEKILKRYDIQQP